MTETLLHLKELRPQIERAGFDLDIIRLDKIANDNSQSLAEKIMAYEEAEFYIRARIVCDIYANEHQSSDAFDELFMRTTRNSSNPVMTHTFEIVPFLDGKLNKYFLQYTDITCKDIRSIEHNDSKSGFDLRAQLVILSIAGSENLVDAAQHESHVPEFVMHAFEPKQNYGLNSRGNRTKAYQIITAK